METTDKYNRMSIIWILTVLIFFCSFSDKNLPPGFPTILKNPSMKVVEKGRNAILECEAAGEPQVRKSIE